MKYHFITVEGNIGAGKTTLAKQLAEYYNAALLLEQFAENPFLPLFYQDKEKYALPLELSFLKDRYQQLQSSLKEFQDKQELIVADYTILKSPLFAKNNLNEAEFKLFCDIHDMMKTTLPKPDLFIYLHTPVERLQRHIKKRGRSYEQNISARYLMEIEDAYLQYFKQHPDNVLWLDNTTVDFNEPQYFNQLTKYIESEGSLPEGILTF
ncbi:deoxynucleoside kinase [Taibaiella lutea]|uniref:Deoxynucleoside kinase n=1 Tax=Taibaiella lutea TaxID=2608001 RepID=A0A5M6CTQ6_9BACT|nr:deoxynucleoside kinase [Taibaiella lutea]KAA5537352.1 deoxynucleoside kinase [Taibaiella lutea]